MSKAKQQNIWYLQNLARHYEKLQHPYIHQESKDLIYEEAHLDHIACFSSGLLFSPAAYSPTINWGWSLLFACNFLGGPVFWKEDSLILQVFGRLPRSSWWAGLFFLQMILTIWIGQTNAKMQKGRSGTFALQLQLYNSKSKEYKRNQPSHA